MIDEVARALARIGATEAVPALHEALKKFRSGDFESLAGALADLGDFAPIEKALAGSSRLEREAAAKYLCAKGDRRGVQVLLEMDPTNCAVIDLLNAVRSPAEWKALREISLRVCLAGDRTRLLERIGARAGLKTKLVPAGDFESASWWHGRGFAGGWDGSSTALEALNSILERGSRCGQSEAPPKFNFILERDSIVVLPAADARKFWQKWWADEQAKKK